MANKNTFNSLLDQGVEKLPPLRRRVYQRRLRNAEYRRQVTDELMLKMADDPRVQAFGLAVFNEVAGRASAQAGEETVAAMGGQAAPKVNAADVEIQLDPGKLKEFLDILLEYLPKIFELILGLFG